MNRILLIVLGLMLLVMGCSRPIDRESGSDSPMDEVEIEESEVDAEEESDREQEEPDLDFQTGEQLMEQVRLVINSDDAKGLLELAEYSWPQYFSLEQMKAAIEDYRIMAGNETIESYEWVGEHPYSQDIQIYRLKTGSGRQIEFSVSEREGIFRATDYVMYYADFKNKLMDRYVQALSERELEKLRSIIYHDESGLVYPLDLTERVIARYEEAFDLSTLQWRFTGETGEFKEFVVEITGSKDGVNSSHQILVIHGDGQVGLSDDWIPEFN